MEWEEILRSIGAKKSNWRLLSSELGEISSKLKTGELLTGEEVHKIKDAWQSTEPFIDEGGKPFVLYIYDRSFGWIFPGSSKYKFHFKWCSTLERMDRDGRRARYKGKWDIDNPVFDSSGDREEELDVCQNCLKSFNFYGGVYQEVSEFNMREFFDTYGIQNLRNPTHQPFAHTYTEDWSTVARDYKQSEGWRCEGCGADFSRSRKSLHVHHVNGVKDDNTKSNLKALCYTCHSDEPAHGHLKHINR